MSATPPVAARRPPRPWRRSLFRYLIGLFFLAVLLVAAYVWLALSWSFAEGERAGYVQKFSRKGWICKTWEGELAMANLPGAMPEVWPFTVRDPMVAVRINDSMGKRVSLHYEQHRGLPTTCFGETDYFVVDVKGVEP